MKYELNKILNFLLMAILILGIVLTITPVAYAQTTTLEIVNPVDGTHDFNYTTTQKSVGDTITINITVKNVQDLQTWQVAVHWDPTMLNYSSIVLPPDHVFAGKTFYPVGPDVHYTEGTVYYGAVLGPGMKTFNGSGTPCQLTLTILEPPTFHAVCNISFINYPPYQPSDTFLLNSIGMDISFTPIEGHYYYSIPWVPPPSATLYINPERVVDPTLTVGSSFNVNLSIINATDLHHWKAKILYDKGILNATEVLEGTFLKSADSTIFHYEIRDYNATHRLVDMNCTLTSVTGVNGSGDLAIIAFKVQGLGLSYITISEPGLRNPSNMALPFIWYNGYFNNMLIAKLSIDPSEVSGPEYTPRTTFTINVTLDDVENLKTCIFNLTYVPSVIQEITINFPSVLGKIPIKKLQVDDDAGYIWAKLTYTEGITTYEPVPIMTIMFQVVNLGISPINLTSTQLYDLNGQSITHEVHHGIFIGLIRDVAVTNVSSDLDMAYQGWVVLINVTVKNKGNMTETFEVKFYFDSTLGGTATVENLNPDEERTITITWDTKNVEPCHNYTIKAYAGPVPYELNLSDNELTAGVVKIWVMGDVNGDGIVDGRDVTEAILAFRAFPRHPKWNPQLDLDRNNLIDARDVVIIILNFQKKCT
jgi:hypothetical protein